MSAPKANYWQTDDDDKWMAKIVGNMSGGRKNSTLATFGPFDTLAEAEQAARKWMNLNIVQQKKDQMDELLLERVEQLKEIDERIERIMQSRLAVWNKALADLRNDIATMITTAQEQYRLF